MPITTVPQTDTPNAGRVKWNSSDVSLQAEIDADEAALATHKTSDDHDGRYYTESEIDTFFSGVSDVVTALTAALAARRPTDSIWGVVKETKSAFSMDGVDGMVWKSDRSGCIMSVAVKRIDNSDTEYKTQSWRSSGTAAQGRFVAGDLIGFHRNTSTGANYPTINGTAVNAAGLDGVTIITEANNFAVKMRVEYDV